MRIPDDKIEEVRSAADILDVVSDFVEVKKKGSNYFGLCPFHNEKSPSFSVNPGLGIYKCFGCGKGGDVFSFLMELEGASYPEAVRSLAEQFSIELPVQGASSERVSDLDSIFNALRLAGRYFYDQLMESPRGKEVALPYLRSRDFSDEIIRKFGIGYAPDGYEGLIDHARENHVAVEVLLKAGLVNPGKDGRSHYDTFRDRVMFPLFSHVGKVVGFTGRTLEKNPKSAKYVNSRETAVYKKGQTLYGLSQGRRDIRETRLAILVEGQTDVVRLVQAGLTNTVGSSGTALTSAQVSLISRYAKKVLVVFDSDSAGATAAARSIDLLLADGLEVALLRLPDGADPDSYVREEGAEAFRELAAKKQMDFVDFKVSAARAEGELESPEGQLRTATSVLTSIRLIPNNIVQEAYIQNASRALQISEHLLRKELRNVKAPKRVRDTKRAEPQEVTSPDIPMTAPAAEPRPEEKLLIRLMLAKSPDVARFILSRVSLDDFTPGAARETVSHLVELIQKGEPSSRPFTEGVYGSSVRDLTAGILMEGEEVSRNWEARLRVPVPGRDADPMQSAIDAVKLLKFDRIDERLAHLRGRLRDHLDEDSEREIMQSIKALQHLRLQIESDSSRT